MDMDDFKIDYKFNLEDFKDVEEIEKTYFESENISSAEEVMKWYEKNALTSVGVRNKEGKIIASVNILPLKYEAYKDIYDNKINEADITYEELEIYEDNMECYLYLSSISIHNEYRNNPKVLMMLIKGTIEILDILKKRKIRIKEVLADAGTVHGRKICEKLLKMEFITDTFHGTKIYNIDGDTFIKVLNEFEQKIRKRI